MVSRLIAVTMGDPAGVGPEIALKALRALASREGDGAIGAAIVGAMEELQRANDALELGARFRPAVFPGEAGAVWPEVAVVETGPAPAPIAFGQVSPAAGHLAYEAVATAVRLAMAGDVGAIATAPLNKEALNLGGHHYAGHTDMLADLTGAGDSCMMLAHGPLRVTHVTTHVPLSRVPSLLTPARLERTLTLTLDALTRLGIARPRIAVAALNPHAGEGGLFGKEDDDVTVPVVRAWRARGHDVEGPVPGDTVFVKAAAGQFDAVVAMYHDQGHIPIKLLGFRIDPATGAWTGLSGVNVTLGLPIIRTSVDHGTAFDIAGRGIANEQSMIEAIELAAALAGARP
ncbi:4-hydroxythreonine-4-phosphate dehydrogenase PdxA [Elioraea rosea]|uniref:4-hydroxythreonine-4-phosphate dehydrogenase PdxA n=1 Tax=Elioraea rosea TaxID=2492390 RepID=UPI0011830D1A|nr:4-hydroxythreonine-4-phosphate dehydrogenase PdxA [Elioraea rosea]